jgi:hypothetical protein
MNDRGDDPFEESDEDAEIAEQIERHTEALYDLVSHYMDDEDLHPGAASRLLFSIALQLHMASYAMEVEKPSISGLKIALDRCRREFDDLIRSAKKHSEDFIDQLKEVRAAVAADLGEEEGGGA